MSKRFLKPEDISERDLSVIREQFPLPSKQLSNDELRGRFAAGFNSLDSEHQLFICREYSFLGYENSSPKDNTRVAAKQIPLFKPGREKLAAFAATPIINRARNVIASFLYQERK